jgi:hypothetical protein
LDRSAFLNVSLPNEYSRFTHSIASPGGQTSGTVTLNAAPNKALKKNKTAIMTLQSGAGYKLGKSKTATVTITP